MIPVLFKGNETNFNHNGIGLLKDTLSSEVTEVGNGSFDLELVYPITGPYFKDLKNGNIIQAKPNDTDQPHNFRITEIDKTLYDKEVVVYGVSITNDLGGNMVKSLYLADVTPQVILNEMKRVLHYPTTFNFVSNITTIGTVDWSLNNPLNLIVGDEGSLVDIFGGEVKRANDTIFLYGRRGKDNVTTIRTGKNLDGFKMTESFQGKYTQILPYFKYEEEVPGEIAGDTEGETVRQEVTVFGSIVSSPYHGRYPVNAIKPIDFSQNEVVRESKSLKTLNSVASKYFSNLYSEIDKPSVSINVDMIQLVDSEQYELYERLEKVELTDTVSVYVPEYDVDILVKINELKYDSLRERTISIVASSSSSGRTSLMDEISGSYKQFTTTLVDNKIQSATSGIINQILTQKNGSNMYAGRATPPDNSKPGDIWFKDTGGGDVELYEFDGVNWVRKMYKGFGDDVRQLVDDKIAESNALFTGALDEQAEAVEQAKALAQLAKTTATNASLSASAANQNAQQAFAYAYNARTELLGRVNTLDSKAADLTTKATDLKTQADNISSQLNTLSTETGTKFQNQSKILTDLQGNVTGIEERISKQRVGSRNLLLGTRDNDGYYSNYWEKTSEEYLGVKVARRSAATYGIFHPVKIYKGIDYIFSFYFKVDPSATGSIVSAFTKNGLIVGNDVDKTPATLGPILNSEQVKPIAGLDKDTWLFNSVKITATSDGWIWPRVEKTTATGYLYIGPRQFEEGNIPTQWHPNEEDVSNEEKIYRSDIDNTLSQYSSTIQTLDGAVTNHTSQLTQQATQIASKVSQTEFNTEKTKISGLQTSITQQANQIALKANTTAVDTLSGRVSTAEGKITTQAGQIELKAEKTYVDTLKQTVDSHTTSITQQANQIALKANTTAVDTLSGRVSTAEGKITTQAGQIELKAEKTYVDTLKQTVDSHTTSITQQANQIALKANQTDYNNLTGRMSTAESSITQNATEISTRLTSTQVNQAILDNKKIKDTRSNNQNPQWYHNNYPRQTVEEFKESAVIGLTGESTYAMLTTNVHWTGPSGGKVKQTAKTDEATYERYGQYTSWDPWVKIANSSDLSKYTTKTEFQTVKETTSLYERVIGSTEVDVKDKIARIVMTDSSFVSEVAKYGEHTSNLVQDSVRFSTTRNVNGSGPIVIADGNIAWRKSGATTNTGSGIGIPVNVKRFIAGEKYTLSFEYYLYQAPDAEIGIEIKDHTNNITYSYGVIANASTPIKTYRYFQQTFTIAIGTASNTIIQDLYFRLTKNGDIGIRNVMFVRGEKIGPYSTSQVDSVYTRVEQTANSYSIKFLNNANDITTQLNLTNSATRIKSSLIHLDGNVTVSGTAWMDGAIIKNLSADKITTGTLNANNVNITNLSVNSVSGITATYLQSIIGTAFIDWMKGKIIQGYNNNMTIDLLGGNITLNSGSNAIKRVKGTHTAFVHFNDVAGSTDGNVGSVYAAIGVTSSGDGVNSSSSGRFAGLRAFRAASGTNHLATVDQTELYGDKVVFKDDFTLARGFLIRPAQLDKQYDLNDDILNPIRFFARLLLHLNNTGWNWQSRTFLTTLANEWDIYGLSRYGNWNNNTVKIP